MNRYNKTKAVALGLAALAFSLTAPVASAAKVKINGGYVTLGNDKVLRLGQSSGRYTDLGRNYYRTTGIGCTSIQNTSKKGVSGVLSLEYWALPFIDSTEGKPLMSVLLPRVEANKQIKAVKKSGPAAYYNAYGYIQLRLYELSGGIWKLRYSKNIGSRQLL
jgi:hypothetical protein